MDLFQELDGSGCGLGGLCVDFEARRFGTRCCADDLAYIYDSSRICGRGASFASELLSLMDDEWLFDLAG